MHSNVIIFVQFLLIIYFIWRMFWKLSLIKDRGPKSVKLRLNPSLWAKFEFNFDRSLTRFISQIVAQINFYPKVIL